MTTNQAYWKQRQVHFVTGRLAETALRPIIAELAKELDFSYTIGVMPITVAALMTPRWLLRHLQIPEQTTDILLPGFIGNDIESLQATTTARIHVGPKDLRDLPEFLSGKKTLPADLSSHQIEIIAEINHAPRLPLDQLLLFADRLRSEGADVIDVGCDPGRPWSNVGTAVKELVAAGHRVSIDSFDPEEVRTACQAGASLVLSVNQQNVALAKEWESEVVAIPDTPTDLVSLNATIDRLTADKVPFRLDPILEPIGLGFADSLVRYHRIRSEYPDAKMMMGIGNLTELTDADSAPINLILLGICAELRIESVLTTQVINWARSSVRECELARRIAHYAVSQKTVPKRLNEGLVMLRDGRLHRFPPEVFQQLAQSIRDPNYRLYAQDDELHLIGADLHLVDKDAFFLFERLMAAEKLAEVDPSHAFYLGFELAKASIALQLGKQYTQDQALRWGILTVEEPSHRLERGKRLEREKRKPPQPE